MTQSEGKIFGIGMPRTGTMSLARALTLLGYRAVHAPRDGRTAREVTAGDFRLSLLDKADALLDTPIWTIFRELDTAWPDARFILTVRDRESWLAACGGLWRHKAPPREGTVAHAWRLRGFGRADFDEADFAARYDAHHDAVAAHFAGAAARRLLVLDVIGGDGWDKLCGFLGRPVPEAAFPYEQARSRAPGDKPAERPRIP